MEKVLFYVRDKSMMERVCFQRFKALLNIFMKKNNRKIWRFRKSLYICIENKFELITSLKQAHYGGKRTFRKI